MGNNQEALEPCTCLQGHSLTGIVQMWCDGSYDHSVAIDGYRLSRKDRLGDKEGVSLSVSMTSWSPWSFAWGWGQVGQD